MNKKNQGFTLVEIMIVVAIIAILAAVAIPNFIKYRDESQKNTCISNMKQLQTAGEQWLITNGAAAAPGLSDLCGPQNYVKTTPTCPYDKGNYTISLENGAIKVACTHATDKGHVIPTDAASGGDGD